MIQRDWNGGRERESRRAQIREGKSICSVSRRGSWGHIVADSGDSRSGVDGTYGGLLWASIVPWACGACGAWLVNLIKHLWPTWGNGSGADTELQCDLP
jgi:hypothetical protein